MKKMIIVLLTLAVCFYLGSIALGGKKSTSDEFTRERIKRSVISPVPKSEVVTTGKVTWKILSVEESGPVLQNRYMGATLETKGKFITIRFEVVNHGEDTKFIFDLRVVDDRGRTYPICVAAYAYLGGSEACMLAELLPEIEQTFTMTHDIPSNAHDLWLEVTDLNTPPGEKAYIDLGI